MPQYESPEDALVDALRLLAASDHDQTLLAISFAFTRVARLREERDARRRLSEHAARLHARWVEDERAPAPAAAPATEPAPASRRRRVRRRAGAGAA